MLQDGRNKKTTSHRSSIGGLSVCSTKKRGDHEEQNQRLTKRCLKFFSLLYILRTKLWLYNSVVR